MNCFIETLSYLPANLDLEKFSERDFLIPEENIIIKGRQTNEAPSKYLMRALAKEGKLFDKAIVLVTNECIGDNFRISALKNRTTYEYYIDEMKTYIGELSDEFIEIKNLLNRRYGGSIDNYVDSVFKYVLVPSNPSKEQSKDIVESVISVSDDGCKDIKLSLDYTGGSRVASLIALLIVRIFEYSDAKLDKVVYANILKKPFEIVNLIETYNLLQSVENIAKAKSIGSNRGVLEELKKMQLATEKDIQSASRIDMETEIAAEKYERMSAENQEAEKKELDELSDNSTGLAKQHLKTGAEQVAKINKASPFSKLIKNNNKYKSDQTIIVDFYEILIGILCDLNIIIYEKSDLKGIEEQKEAIQKAIQANDSYYIRYNKKGKVQGGVIPQVRKWIVWLARNPQFNPIKNFEIKRKIRSGNYDMVSTKNFVKGINYDLTNVFIDYIKENKIDKEIESEFDNFTDAFKEYEKLQRIYFNYGYPFMCVSVKSDDIYPEITDYYINKTYELMSSLEALKKSDKDSYAKELEKLMQDETYLMQKLPYMVNMSLWGANADKFNSDIESENFIKSLCQRIEEVRPYRNAISHKLKNKYSDITAIKNIANKIKTWATEYDEQFSD